MFMVISLALCISATAMARWSRSSGSNALVLQAREEALRAEQAKQRILAANMERDRISESIQSEVTMTLTSVIDQAVAGLRMLDDCERHGEQPSSGAISRRSRPSDPQGRAALHTCASCWACCARPGSAMRLTGKSSPACSSGPRHRSTSSCTIASCTASRRNETALHGPPGIIRHEFRVKSGGVMRDLFADVGYSGRHE